LGFLWAKVEKVADCGQKLKKQ